MKETYAYLARYTNHAFEQKSNEELKDIYRNSRDEYEKSQAFSSIFINNFFTLLKISNKYSHVESSEKSGMICEEILKAIRSYDGSTKFITYLTAMVENMFVWDYTNNKKRVALRRNTISLDEKINEDEDYEFQIKDEEEELRTKNSMFILELNSLFDKEISSCPNTASGLRYKNKLEDARKLVMLYLNRGNMTASQVARAMGWYTKKGIEGKTVDKSKFPDYKVVEKIIDGTVVTSVEKISAVKEGQWSKVIKMKRFIKELLENNGFDKNSIYN